jgi:hypothetical protein
MVTGYLKLYIMKPIIVSLLSSLLLFGCTNKEPDVYEANKCYEGTLITAFCPSVAVVSVDNANIGVDWEHDGKKYKNAITIYNADFYDPDYDTLRPNRQVYFTIDIDATAKGDKCYRLIHCPAELYDMSSPDVGICAKTTSTKPCE